ncbi:MAG: transcription termination factor Rho [Actinomycetota bacterium]
MAAEALERSALEGKDKDQLTQIAKALGVTGISKLKKADLVSKIIDATGGDVPAANDGPAPGRTNGSSSTRSNGAPTVESAPVSTGDDTSAAAASAPDAGSPSVDAVSSPAGETPGDAPAGDAAPTGPDGEPLADWEIELAQQGISTETTETTETTRTAGTTAGSSDTADASASSGSSGDGQRSDGAKQSGGGQSRDAKQSGGGQGGDATQSGGQGRNKERDGRNQSGRNQQGRNQDGRSDQGGRRNDEPGEGNSKRRRRRRKGRGGRDEGPQGEDLDLLDEDGQPQSNEPVEVAGYLDIRDEGYGFLRVNGYLPSKQDAYIPVKLTRQYGLRKGDHLTGKMRPAQRNEKNPALLEVFTVNGGDPQAAKKRPRFDDLTALFPDERLTLEDPSDPTNMTARIIDLISPIGKGQRGLLVSPPKAGKTTVMKTIAKMIEQNNPETKLIMLLIDERPEEVTDIKRTVKGEVISSTFDRPSDEHTHVAEMAIAKAKRMVEDGTDVVIMLDGITRLSRAYNLAAPASGRILSGGIDAGALYPPKKFFGAARNCEEGGSLTILATALVDTNSRMDEAIFEEFKGTGNMELRLDRKVAERRIYPAIDVDASSTRHEELLFDRKQLQMVWKLRRVLSGLAADGNAAPGLELLMDRLKTFRTNAEFLAEIAKQPGM